MINTIGHRRRSSSAHLDTTNRLSGSEERRPPDAVFGHRQSFSGSTPVQRPAPGAPGRPIWAGLLPREKPRLAFPMFVVVAAAPSTVVIAVPFAVWAFGFPALSGLVLGILAILLTWGGLAILMRYQENWESAPPRPPQQWQPPAHPEHVRAVFA